MVYPKVSLYSLMLAAAGIPLYIHLPRFASVNLGVGLGVVGAVLLAIRLIDLVQDPLIGWAIDRWPSRQLTFGILAAAGLAVGFPLLFFLQAGPYVVFELMGVLILLFSAYSLGTILLYGRSATLAQSPQTSDLMTLACWREVGMLAGVILAALMPTLFESAGASDGGYGAFGIALGAIAIVTAVLTRSIWKRSPVLGDSISFSGMANAGALRLLLLALINSLPVAITSTLFLFFVEDRLQLAGKAGLLLIVFFLSAGLSVPFWTRLSHHFGRRNTLLIAMPLSILGFVGAAFLAPGNLAGFVAICIASGAALGADMVLLPAMFSIALTGAGLNASAAFGLWSFAGKLGLALAAFTVLPVLEWNGFKPGQTNTAQALSALNLSYAVIPCILKLVALGFVLSLAPEERTQ
ncbi:MFS transporter [Tropicibacter sp. Alg240-R139]|uniref:MFS transporter n=1 Tax=Tropicibacter sp. Alg240-R139 TaxID=2305991 RepID=UPI0013DF5CD7|nr:MFS transporter [Tropicibacter sp. Alg240-R139]